MPLTDIAVRNAKPSAKAVRLFDEKGLYLEVSPAGGKWWRLKYRINGKEKRISLGTYPDTSLRMARDKRDEARQMLAAGTDPSAERQASKKLAPQEAEQSFRHITLAWLEHQASRWTPKTMERIRANLEADVFPELGAVPMADIRAKDVMLVVRQIESRGVGETAARTLQRIKAVFRYAVRESIIETNPTLDVLPEEVLKPRKVKHRAALPEAELAEFLHKLDAYDGEPATKNALQLLVLTALRPGELRGARWEEIDLEAARWRVPAERMKMKAEHVVPLSRQAVALLTSIRPADDVPAGLVFPSPFYPGSPLSENTLNSALARMGYKGIATAHGFRALFSTVANEAGKNPDVIERQLAHAERNEVRAAYHRSTYLADRAKLMQWWADFLDKKKAGSAKVQRRRGG